MAFGRRLQLDPHPDISVLLRSHIVAGDFPSAVYLVWEAGETRYSDSLGNAVVEPEIIPAGLDTIYDLASLTKVLVPTLLTAKLLEKGLLQNDDAIARFLTETDLGDKGSIRIGELFTHTTGLPGWIPFYLLVAQRDDILDEIVRTPTNAERNAVVYGDPNFWLVAFVLERILGTTLDNAARDLITGPLGLRDTMYNPPAELKPRLAAQERGTAFERQLCRDLGYELPTNRARGTGPFRDEAIWGEVHDNNAWFFGGVTGHAGLFSTAGEVLEIARQFLPGYSQLLKAETCSFFTTDLTPGRNEARSFGFELASSPDTTAGTLMSSQSFGHLGFTGTSLWIDPVKERIFILLTNRTHARDLPFANLNQVRRRFNDLAVEALERDS